MIETMVDALDRTQAPDVSSYGGRLAAAIADAGMDGRGFASKMGVTYMGVFKVLKNQSAYLQTPQHFAACKLLRIRPEWLMYGEGPRREAQGEPGVDWRTLAMLIANENPEAADRDLLLHFCDLVDGKAAQMRQAAASRAKAHTP